MTSEIQRNARRAVLEIEQLVLSGLGGDGVMVAFESLNGGFDVLKLGTLASILGEVDGYIHTLPVEVPVEVQRQRAAPG